MDATPPRDWLDQTGHVRDRASGLVYAVLFVAFTGFAVSLSSASSGTLSWGVEESVAGAALSVMLVGGWNLGRFPGWYAVLVLAPLAYYMPHSQSYFLTSMARSACYFTLLYSFRRTLSLLHIVKLWLGCSLILLYGFLIDPVARTHDGYLVASLVAAQPLLLLASNALLRLLAELVPRVSQE